MLQRHQDWQDSYSQRRRQRPTGFVFFAYSSHLLTATPFLANALSQWQPAAYLREATLRHFGKARAFAGPDPRDRSDIFILVTREKDKTWKGITRSQDVFVCRKLGGASDKTAHK